MFVGLTEVAGFYARLAEGFRENGVAVTYADLSGNPFAYPVPAAPVAVMWAQRAARARTRARRPLARAITFAIHRVALTILFIWAAARHDAFVFSYRTTFARFAELRLLRLLGRRVLYVFNGSDARPTYIDGAEMSLIEDDIDACIERTRRKRAEIREIERWADVVVAHPLYMHLFTRATASIQALGVPAPAASSRTEPTRVDAGTVRVLHAPSNEAVKGTTRIREAVHALVREGLPIQYTELRDVPNHVVQAALAECDFVIDQAFSDLPMSVFALEAAVHGKPAVVGSYGWDEIDRLLPPETQGPVERAHPDRLIDAIRRLAADADRRHRMGQAARDFASGWAARAVAQRYLTLMSGSEEGQVVRATDCRYLHGVGMPQEKTRAIVAEVISRAGVGALSLDHRPDLERRFVAFAEGSEAAILTDGES